MTQTNKNLMTCPSCSQSMAKSAKACPHCGAKAPLNWDRMGKVILVFIVLFFIPSFANMILDPDSIKPQPAPYSAEREKCRNEIYAGASHPSTVNVQSIMGYGFEKYSNGAILITQTFSAKNSFGLEQKYMAYCHFGKTGKFFIEYKEQNGG